MVTLAGGKLYVSRPPVVVAVATGEGWTDSVGNSTEIGRAIARSVRLNCQKKLELNVISRTKERKGSRVQLIVEGTTNGGPAKLNEKPDL